MPPTSLKIMFSSPLTSYINLPFYWETPSLALSISKIKGIKILFILCFIYILFVKGIPVLLYSL